MALALSKEAVHIYHILKGVIKPTGLLDLFVEQVGRESGRVSGTVSEDSFRLDVTCILLTTS